MSYEDFMAGLVDGAKNEYLVPIDMWVNTPMLMFSKESLDNNKVTREFTIVTKESR